MATETQPYPVSIRGDLTEPLSPGLWLIKWLLLVPHLVILAFLWIGAVIAWLISMFAILFTGKYPRGLFDYNVGVLRWSWRVSFYGYHALGTDRYPPFTLQSVDYPADLNVTYPERLSQGLVLIKWWLLAFPHLIIVGVFQGGWGYRWGGLIVILTIIAGVVLLFRGKYPKDIFDLVMGFNRWSFRVAGYVTLMTDRYPPFRLGD
ncbi:MAG: DUF4389 domain-containing protein [Chloroflexi bacterium]|nr:DUF4389 domain-containing protein [Chloroflexota bacterium]